MNSKEITSQGSKREETKANYDRLSRWYDLLAGLAEKKYKDIGLNKLAIKSGEKVLEIGFGTGQCIVKLAQSVGDLGKVYGVDLSDGMFRVAKSKITKAGLSEKVKLICGDAVELPYNENSTDVIFMSFTLELFDAQEIPIVLNQCQRVLTPAGRICIVTMAKRNENNLMLRLYNWAHKSFPQSVDCRPINARGFLEEVGFSIIDTTEMTMFGLPVDILLARNKNEKGVNYG